MIRPSASLALRSLSSSCPECVGLRAVRDPRVGPAARSDEAAAKAPVELPPIESDRFVIAADSDVVGEVQVIRARYEDTFVDIARAYDLGYDELVQANPGVDPWLPGAGTRIVLPTQFILPDAPREGIVLNIGAKRIFYYPKVAAGESPVVVTHPVGIGREGWATPIGSTTVVSKAKDPVWTVPASIRKEHAEAGDPLPARVPAGPDNPLGAYALAPRLSVLPDPWHQQAFRHRHARESRLRAALPRGHRVAVQPGPGGYARADRESAAVARLACRQPVPGGAPGTGGRPAQSSVGAGCATWPGS